MPARPAPTGPMPTGPVHTGPMHTGPIPTAPMPTGAWQGALRPPVFHINPMSRTPQRPTYREPMPVLSGRVTAGVGIGVLWMLLFAAQAGTLRAYAWLTIVAAVLAWTAAGVLVRFGDRGVAVGAAAGSGVGLAVAGLVVAINLAGGRWLLW